MDEVIIATRNEGKIKEFETLFSQLNLKVRSLDDLSENIPEIEETGDTFHENAQLKAETVANLMQTPVISDDSGLIIDALDGQPGVYSARYAGEPTNDQKNNEKVLDKMKHVDNKERTARFVAVLALARPGKETIYFEGKCEGKIAFQTIGHEGFGYDPIFIPEGFKMTMAQLSQIEKNQISHRFHALQALKQWLLRRD